MQNDIDEKRKNNRSGDVADTLSSEISRKNRYDRLLRKAQSMDFREIRATNIIYKSGQDKQGRSVFVFVGKNYSPSEVSYIVFSYRVDLVLVSFQNESLDPRYAIFLSFGI